MSEPIERCEVVDQLLTWLEEAFKASSRPQETPFDHPPTPGGHDTDDAS